MPIPSLMLRTPAQQCSGRRGLLPGLFLLALLLLPGCGGCTQTPAQKTAEELKEKLKEREKPKPPFEVNQPSLQPQVVQGRLRYYKPGHWTSVTMECQANYEDYQAELKTSPLAAQDMPFEIGHSRRIDLAKGQPKLAETLLFVPNRYQLPTIYGKPREALTLPVSLTPRGREQTLVGASLQLQPLEPFQFFFVVLAERPQEYASWQKLPCFDAHSEAAHPDNPGYYYQLYAPQVRGTAPLPDHPLAWTSTAYLVWDELPPDVLTASQQQALIDWLHWGGQLIISGPGTINKLRQSFLQPYLPAESQGAATVSADELRNLVRQDWFVPDPEGSRLQPQDGLPDLGVEELELAEQARVELEAASGRPLIVSREVGRGRVVLSAFRLADTKLAAWLQRDDSLLNSAVLGRSPRQYQVSEDLATLSFEFMEPPPTVAGKDTVGSWTGYRDRLQPQQVSRVSFFARDTQPSASLPQYLEERLRSEYYSSGSYNGSPGYPAYADAPPLAWLGEAAGGWSDFNGAAGAAREGLAQLGLRVPERMFVVWVMAIYLVLLVPVNWAFFRLIGKVEWAWVAAPVITVAYCFAIIYLTGVSLGFARQQTELAVIEFQPDYSRAHVTRYTSLYASLATTYDIAWDDPSAVAQPFPKSTESHRWQGRSDLQISHDDKLRLSGLPVASNSWEMLHSEQMYEAGGPIRLESIPANDPAAATGAKLRVKNESTLELKQTELHSDDGWYALGTIPPGGQVDLSESRFTHRNQASSTAPGWQGQSPEFELPPAEMPKVDQEDPHGSERTSQEDDSTDASNPNAPSSGNQGPLSPEEQNRRRVEPLRQLARTVPTRGQWRLIAWNGQALPGVKVSPPIERTSQANLIVAHLRYPEPRAARPDILSRVEATKQLQDPGMLQPFGDDLGAP